MLAIGPGPGPKNVLVLLDDGSKTVVPYAVWKYKYKEREVLAEKLYVVAVGMVQFNPIEREANGQDVLDFTMKTAGTEGVLIRVTLWPEMRVSGDPERGDFVAVDGELKLDTFKGKDDVERQSVSINPYAFHLGKSIRKPPREVVGGDTPEVDENVTVPKKLF